MRAMKKGFMRMHYGVRGRAFILSAASPYDAKVLLGILWDCRSSVFCVFTCDVVDDLCVVLFSLSFMYVVSHIARSSRLGAQQLYFLQTIEQSLLSYLSAIFCNCLDSRNRMFTLLLHVGCLRRVYAAFTRVGDRSAARRVTNVTRRVQFVTPAAPTIFPLLPTFASTLFPML